MRKVTVLCVGRLKEPFYEAAAAEYVKRLGRFCKLEIVELAEQRLPENPSPAEVARGLAKEAEAIRAKLPPAATVVALCVEGRMKSSEELAQLLARAGVTRVTRAGSMSAAFPGEAHDGEYPLRRYVRVVDVEL